MHTSRFPRSATQDDSEAALHIGFKSTLASPCKDSLFELVRQNNSLELNNFGLKQPTQFSLLAGLPR